MHRFTNLKKKYNHIQAYLSRVYMSKIWSIVLLRDSNLIRTVLSAFIGSLHFTMSHSLLCLRPPSSLGLNVVPFYCSTSLCFRFSTIINNDHNAAGFCFTELPSSSMNSFYFFLTKANSWFLIFMDLAHVFITSPTSCTIFLISYV